jgi:hypothetical protein
MDYALGSFITNVHCTSGTRYHINSSGSIRGIESATIFDQPSY